MRFERVTIEIDGVIASTDHTKIGRGTPWRTWDCDDWDTIRRIRESGADYRANHGFPVIAAGRRVARALGGRVVKEECDRPIPENLAID